MNASIVNFIYICAFPDMSKGLKRGPIQKLAAQAKSFQTLSTLLLFHDLLTFLSSSTRGGSRPQVMSCWICLQGPAAMFDNAHAASFCTLAFECLISWGRTFRTPASTAVWVCRSEPLTMFPMDRRAGVWRSGQTSTFGYLATERLRTLGGFNDPGTHYHDT